jgi:hypothetical protein
MKYSDDHLQNTHQMPDTIDGIENQINDMQLLSSGWGVGMGMCILENTATSPSCDWLICTLHDLSSSSPSDTPLPTPFLKKTAQWLWHQPTYFLPRSFFGGWDWNLNSGLCTCKAGVLLLSHTSSPFFCFGYHVLIVQSHCCVCPWANVHIWGRTYDFWSFGPG